ncbi:type II toxin-antitoxin system prevent-host-death family antitoxin [Burkholderia cenocepacia]|nr:type II toxin-antitoxin system prevent-host-death family antitoxin [Burkholderia cenocepacia]MBR8484788.1 type II toxin-antitoxin system prevent-host-death family antitoxin [Burkholderia cenocepacia]RQU21352.1 type II toxin-antitoxin system prevent-host-death family antitoxin [Burkholderia cenocepacia]RQV39097.1 type II toxin-antitoxin system prevent-host-death family antitoxin [Burkholderia cenocepacia]RQV48606.1 type II toxin-antitoxin system prevent-host-death family antitoxin [Burkholder
MELIMQVATVPEATLDLQRLLDAAIAGERVVITQAGKQAVRLVPLRPIHPFGAMEGEIWIADDFDAPLPDDLLDAFEGK